MTVFHKYGVFCVVVGSLFIGCSSSPMAVHSDQESLGKGIVVGSIAEQRKHEAMFASWPSSLTIKGQVTKIEGAAYLVTHNNGGNVRLPVDQETTIDRPAHIGDWIEAYTDNSGRALQIRNIDEEVIVEEN